MDTYIAQLKEHNKDSQSNTAETKIVEVTKVVSSIRDKLMFAVIGLAVGIGFVLLHISGSFKNLWLLTKAVFTKKK